MYLSAPSLIILSIRRSIIRPRSFFFHPSNYLSVSVHLSINLIYVSSFLFYLSSYLSICLSCLLPSQLVVFSVSLFVYVSFF